MLWLMKLYHAVFEYCFFQIDGLVQKRRNYIALAMELRLFALTHRNDLCHCPNFSQTVIP